MKRLIYDSLLTWKEVKSRKSLIIEGIRQCGKTWILKHFGESEFKDVVISTSNMMIGCKTYSKAIWMSQELSKNLAL